MDSQHGDARRVRSLSVVHKHSGPRSRTVDEHMFSVGKASFRLQLFCAPGLRPVAVATQTNREGASLTNRAERFVEAIWQQHCSDEAQPPIFIAHQLWSEDRDLGLRQTDFIATGQYTVASPPKWGPKLTTAELATLVGEPVDLERGIGYVEPKPPNDGTARFVTVAVVTLPRPDMDGDLPCMMAGTPWWRRLARQVVPHRSARGCCWYHGGDWFVACATAIRLLRNVLVELGEDAEHDERLCAALQLARDENLDNWTLAAVESLLIDPIQPDRDGGGYINGRHRSQAMLDAGVRRTVVEYWDWPENYCAGTGL